jgi:hypothetical protein
LNSAANAILRRFPNQGTATVHIRSARHIAFSHDHAEEHSVRRAPAFRITLGSPELSIIVTTLFVAILTVALAIAAKVTITPLGLVGLLPSLVN